MVNFRYHPETIQVALEEVYPDVMRKIRFERSAKLLKEEKAAAGTLGFVPVPARWVIERSNAWMDRCKGLVKNLERTLAHAKCKIDFCFVRLMLKRLGTV